MMDALRARLPPCAVSNIVVNQHSDLGTTSSHLTFYVQHLQAPNRPQITPNLIRSPLSLLAMLAMPARMSMSAE